MSEYKLSALLELKDKFTGTAQKAKSSLGELKNQVGGAVGKIKNAFSGVNGVLASVGAGIGTATVVGVLKSSLESYANLEDQVRRNKAIMGATAEQEKQLMQQTRDLGRSTKFTAQEVAEAQMYQAMAGMKTNEVLEMTPKLLKMSIAAGSDFAQTSDIVTDNLTAFGMSLKDSDRLMDVMVATSNNANTNVQMLGESYKYVAATSRNFESFEDVNILLGVLADNGIKSGQAGRNLAGIYRRLANPSKQVGNALKDLNIQLYDQQGHFRGLKALSDDLKIATAGLTEEERNRYLTMIAGGEGMKILASIMGTTEENYNKVANAVRNSSGATDKFANDMSNTTANKIAQFKSAIDDLKISLGEAFAPIATRWMEDFMTKVDEWQKSGALNPDKLKGQAEGLVKTAELGMRGFIAAKGASLGASLGSAIAPGVGTAVGAAIGGAIGAFSPEIVKGAMAIRKQGAEMRRQEKAFFEPRGAKPNIFGQYPGGYAAVEIQKKVEAENARIARQKEYDRSSAEALKKVVFDMKAFATKFGMQQQNPPAITTQDKTAQIVGAISQLLARQNSNPLQQQQPFDPSVITNAISSGLSPLSSSLTSLNNLPSLLNTSLATMQPPVPQPVSIEQVINHSANAQIAAQLSNITINDTAKIESIARQIAQSVSQNTYNAMMSNLQAQIQASK